MLHPVAKFPSCEKSTSDACGATRRGANSTGLEQDGDIRKAKGEARPPERKKASRRQGLAGFFGRVERMTLRDESFDVFGVTSPVKR